MWRKIARHCCTLECSYGYFFLFDSVLNGCVVAVGQTWSSHLPFARGLSKIDVYGLLDSRREGSGQG